MQRVKTALVAALGLMMLALAAPTVVGQPGDKKAPDYTKPDPAKDVAKSSTNLKDMLGKMLAVNEVIEAASGKIKGKSGEPGYQAVANLYLNRTVLETIPPIQAECERLRWSLYRSRSERRTQTARVEFDKEKTARDTKAMASYVIGLEDSYNAELAKVNSGGSSDTINDLSSQLAAAKNELLEKLNFLEDLNSQGAGLKARVTECDNEIAQLKSLQNYLESLTRLELVRVDRNKAAVEYQSMAIASNEVEQRRKAIAGAKEFLDGFDKRPPVPSVGKEILDTTSSPLGNPKPADKAAQSEMLKKYLESERAASGKVAPVTTPTPKPTPKKP